MSLVSCVTLYVTLRKREAYECNFLWILYYVNAVVL